MEKRFKSLIPREGCQRLRKEGLRAEKGIERTGRRIFVVMMILLAYDL